MADERDDFATWVDMWEKAQKNGIFPEQPKLVPGEEEGSSSDTTNAYWSYFDSEVINEDHAGRGSAKRDLADQARDMGKSPNPVFHHTVGNDQDLEPWTPNWIDGKELNDLAELKKDLHNLECELNAKEANAQNATSVEKRITTMKQRLHDLSNALTPDRFKEILD